MYLAQQNIGNYQAGQSAHPPRFNPPVSLIPGMRSGANNGGSGGLGRKLNVVTEPEGRKTPQSQSGSASTISAYLQQQYQQQRQENRTPSSSSRGSWDQQDSKLANRTSNPNLQYMYQHGSKAETASAVPSVPPIPPQYLQQQSRISAGFGQGGAGGQQQQQLTTSLQNPQNFLSNPIDLPSLIAAKGYNPTNFDIRPAYVCPSRPYCCVTK